MFLLISLKKTQLGASVHVAMWPAKYETSEARLKVSVKAEMRQIFSHKHFAMVDGPVLVECF